MSLKVFSLLLLMAMIAGVLVFTHFNQHLSMMVDGTSHWILSANRINDVYSRHEEILLTPIEMRKLLYEDVPDTDGTNNRTRIPYWQYRNLIRSRLTRPDPSMPRKLARSYDPGTHFSEGGQSRLVDGILRSRRNGFFVECGAHDGEYNSNSLFFELERNWTGLLIEPDPTAYKRLLEKNRKAYTFAGCVSPTRHSQLATFVAAGIYGGIQKEMPQLFKDVIQNKRIPFTVIPSLCFPFLDILDVIGVNHIDYFSLDIEGPEVEVLATIDWNRVRIDILTIEINGSANKLNDSRRLMQRIGGYREVGLKGLDIVFERLDLSTS